MISLEKENELANTLQFSEEEQQQFFRNLWELLKGQSEKYNGIDSCSMPLEKAQGLAASLVYTLSLAAQEDGLSTEALLQRDFYELMKRGQEILENKKKEVFEQWNQLCLEAPEIPNVYYVSTMKELGMFFKRYEIYYDAHQIPCSIDYPLLNPIPDEIKGISFIEEYIRRIKIENQLINSFHFETVITHLQKVILDIREDYINLCEPVLTNAIGRTILGRGLSSFEISKEDITQLDEQFKDKTAEELFIIITKSVQALCKEIGFDERKISYFDKLIRSLATRIEIAVKTGCLFNIFLSGV